MSYVTQYSITLVNNTDMFLSTKIHSLQTVLSMDIYAKLSVVFHYMTWPKLLVSRCRAGLCCCRVFLKIMALWY